MSVSNLPNTYLDGENAKNQIIALTKKTASTQLDIGKKILSMKTKYLTMKENKPDLASTLKEEYDHFLESLPFGKVVANKFIKIAEDELIAYYIDIAPISYNTLTEQLKGIDNATWLYLKGKGMHGYSTANEIVAWKKEYVKSTSPVPPKTPAKDDDAGSKGETPKATQPPMTDLKAKEAVKKSVVKNTNFKVDVPKKELVKGKYFTANLVTSTDVTKEQFETLNTQLNDVVAKFVEANKLTSDDVILTSDVVPAEWVIAA